MSNSLSLIARIASNEVLEAAYQWLCQKRSHYHFNGDIWQLRRWWSEKKAYVQRLLLNGQYRFREQRQIRGKDRDVEWGCNQKQLLGRLRMRWRIRKRPLLQTKPFSS